MEISRDTEARLAEEAQRQGIPVEVLLDGLVKERLSTAQAASTKVALPARQAGVEGASRFAVLEYGFYVGFVVLVAAVGFLTYYIDTRPYFVALQPDPKELSKALDTYAAAGNLLTTLATGVLAGMGWFFTNRSTQRYSAGELFPGVLGCLFACLSIYFGYISSQNVQWLTENAIGTLDLLKIQLPRNLQFYGLLLSVFCFADFLRRDWKVNHT